MDKNILFNKINYKRSQSEVISTVLLVLIGIVAVGILSTYVINLVNNNLRSGDCLGIVGEIKINAEEGYTFFNSSSNFSYLVVERSQKDFNLSGINVILEDGLTSKMYKIRAGKSNTEICQINSNFECIDDISLPQMSNPKVAYRINSSNTFNKINKISIVPVLRGEVSCDASGFSIPMPNLS